MSTKKAVTFAGDGFFCVDFMINMGDKTRDGLVAVCYELLGVFGCPGVFVFEGLIFVAQSCIFNDEFHGSD